MLLIAITMVLSVNGRRTAVQLAVGTIVGVLIARLIIKKVSTDVVNSIASQNRGGGRRRCWMTPSGASAASLDGCSSSR